MSESGYPGFEDCQD